MGGGELFQKTCKFRTKSAFNNFSQSHDDWRLKWKCNSTRMMSMRLDTALSRTKFGGLRCRSCGLRFLMFLFLVQCLGLAAAVELSHCRDALGMQTGGIPDSAITASSSYDEPTVGPQFARIRQERKGGAWCPKPAVDKDSYEYLQIDLQQLNVINLVETQGRFGNGQGQEFTEEYLLEYQREDSVDWKRFRNRKGEEIFKGNENTYMAELREVSPPIIAKRIRFIPYSQHPRTVCMRVEIYGCQWLDATVSYDMPQGDRRGAEVDLYDFTYDGRLVNGYLMGGLGQLTDGEEGDTNFRLDPQNRGMKGYEWVGWKNTTDHKKPSEYSKPIVITFKFDTVRNFTSVMLHCNNYFNKDVRIFRKAEIFFSNGGKYFIQEPVVFSFTQDTVVEYARKVVIRIPHKIGQYMQMRLYFEARWVMISEVKFESTPAVGNFTRELAPPTEIPYMGRERDKKKPSYVENVPINTGNGNRGAVRLNPGWDEISDYEYGGSSDDKSAVEKAPGGSEVMDESYIGIIIGALVAVVIVIGIIIGFLIMRYRRRKQNNNRRGLKPAIVSDNHVTINLNDMHNGCSNGKISNGIMYNSVAQEELMNSDQELCPRRDKYDKYLEPCDATLMLNRKLPDVPLGFSPEASVLLSSDGTYSSTRDYAVPDVTKSSLIMSTFPPNRPPRPIKTPVTTPIMSNTLDKPPNYDALYAAADIVNMQGSNLPNLQGVSGNNVYAVPNAELLLTMDYTVMEFPRDCLKFLEVLGEGQFGEVHLCEAMRITDFLGDDFLINRTTSRSMLVAVKMLREDADDRARADFHKEIKIMSQLKDPNIVRVLGVCTQEEPLCMIVEYMKYGDLHQFLQDHVPESPVAQATNAKTLSYGGIVYVAGQVASGMKYLESLNMVHRDLATRNCLVGHNYTIKISDFGMSRSLYSADYYRIEGKAVLPIRWMAWESILLGKFTTKSDVWSFAVTLWEILFYAKEQPYEGMTDEQVIENTGHYYRNDGLHIHLPQPPNCPREIYDLMRECWNRQESERPTFREIHMFLQRKNMGYNPKDEKMNQINVPVC